MGRPRFVVDLTDRGRVTAAKFRPGGWTALTGLPPAPNAIGPLTVDLGFAPGELLAAMAVLDDDAARATVLDAALARAV
ncbi:MAG: hypothetical protein L0H64_21680, partial [Pseudonocardia sp.]|nr:hypothetical protein [Pseudonocardia sp.]